MGVSKSLGFICIFLISSSFQFEWPAFNLGSVKFLRGAEAPSPDPVLVEENLIEKPVLEQKIINKRDVVKARERYLRRYERQTGTTFPGLCNSETDKCILGGDYIPNDPCVNVDSTTHTCNCRAPFTLSSDGVCKAATACSSADCDIFGYDSAATCQEDPTSTTGYKCTCTAPNVFSTTFGTCMSVCDFANKYLGAPLCTGTGESGPCTSDPASVNGYSCSCASGLTWNPTSGTCEAPVCACDSTTVEPTTISTSTPFIVDTTTTPTTTSTIPTTTSSTPTTTTTTPTTTTPTTTTPTTTTPTTTTPTTTTPTTMTPTTTTPTTTTPTTTTTTPTTTETTTTPTTTTTTPTTTETTTTMSTTTMSTTTTAGIPACNLVTVGANLWTVQSPGYSAKYPVPDTICQTVISYPAGKSFSVAFTVFEIASADTACSDAYVRFTSSGGTNTKLCGVKTGASITLVGNTLTIYLDGSTTLQGRFSVNVRAV